MTRDPTEGAREVIRTIGDLTVWAVRFNDRFPVGYRYEVSRGGQVASFETVADLIKFLTDAQSAATVPATESAFQTAE